MKLICFSSPKSDRSIQQNRTLPSSRRRKISMSSTTTYFALKQTNKDINVVYNNLLSFKQTNKDINGVYNHFICLQADKQIYKCCLQPLTLPSSRQTKISMSPTTTFFAFKQVNKDINVIYNQFLCLQADKQIYKCHLQPLPLPSSRRIKISVSSTTTSFAFKQTNKDINVVYNHFLCLQADKQRYRCCLKPLPLPSSRRTKISKLSTTTSFTFKQTNKNIIVIYNHFLCLQADKQICQCRLQPLTLPSSRQTKISMSSTTTYFAHKQTNKDVNVAYNHFICRLAHSLTH